MYQGRMMVNGRAVTYFGAWSVMKIVMAYVLNYRSQTQEIFEATELPEEYFFWVATITNISLGLFAMLVLLVRFLWGRWAVRQAEKGQVSRVFLILSGCVSAAYLILFVSGCASLWERLSHYYWQGTFSPDILDRLYRSFSDRIVALVVDLTSVAIFCDLFLAALRLKSLSEVLAKPAAE